MTGRGVWAVGLRGQCAEGVCVLASRVPKEGRGNMFDGGSGRFPAWEGCGGDHFRSVPFGVAAKVQTFAVVASEPMARGGLRGILA